MAKRDSRMDEEARPLVEYADEHRGEWVDFEVLDDRSLNRAIHWLVTSRLSPLGWSPDGKPQTSSRSYDLMWKTEDGWTRDIRFPGVFRNGLRIGRLKMRLKRPYKPHP